MAYLQMNFQRLRRWIPQRDRITITSIRKLTLPDSCVYASPPTSATSKPFCSLNVDIANTRLPITYPPKPSAIKTIIVAALASVAMTKLINPFPVPKSQMEKVNAPLYYNPNPHAALEFKVEQGNVIQNMMPGSNIHCPAVLSGDTATHFMLYGVNADTGKWYYVTFTLLDSIVPQQSRKDIKDEDATLFDPKGQKVQMAIQTNLQHLSHYEMIELLEDRAEDKIVTSE